MSNPDSALIASLRSEVDDALRAVLRGARRVALVNFPNHGNPGDPAIWLGTRAALRRIGVRVGYQCAWDTFSAAALRRAVPDGPVLLNGGGNFGDLYQGQQGLREHLLSTLRDRRLVQLPQSIHFRERQNLDRVRRLVAEHGDVTLLVREHRSQEIAAREFDADVRLVPDMAFGLGELPLPGTPRADVLWLHRVPGDPEHVDHGGLPDGVTGSVVEWIHEQPDEPEWRLDHRIARRANVFLRARAQSDARWARYAWRPLGATFAPLGHGWVLRGLHILGRGRVLVTDKLHGHVLALLAGVAHVVLDNGYGKVSGVHESWTHPSTLAHWADNGDEARKLALDLLTG
ncbi:polysaccharide pyruvyl transferase family protein [Actinophytocola algeriensis]|uniref:Pyruvyl transferase EpsO n=1 Tax=Actinophytocola algeriensis TaxID=1768010 RepID=A0A7W7VH26_9PSEU|nr:polysaccharide pyruvyl transferase family protein [Actinophytocola algeriensis]MBB4909630.1 pyruvyl transferase EpsO [Actinophytocola algeriensis]MBE1475620.1 pyruvyl transferase EpsO [Actinophytocola algeriensis]